MYGYLKVASLDELTLNKIKILEKEIDKHIMAFEPGVSLALLTPDEVEKISLLEKEAGVTLLVYNPLDKS